MRYPRLFLAYLALLSVLGFLATDMYLPAFAAMQYDLHTESALISASLSLFLAGFALAQLVWGPVSDKIGRRTVLLCGLTLFSFACAAILWVTDPYLLLFLRFLQACGVCAATVCWQALVIDSYPRNQANKIFATIMPLVALSPALAPIMGVFLLNHWQWRSIFLVLASLAMLLIVLTCCLLPSYSKQTANTHVRLNGKISLIKLFSHSHYSGNVLIYSATSASFFAYLTASPFLLSQFNLDPADIGLSYLPQTLAFLVSGYACRSLLNRFTGNQILPYVLGIYLASIVAFAVIAHLPHPSLPLLLLTFSGTALGSGSIYPIVVAKALRVYPQVSGKAAALQNSLQLGLCFIFSLVVSTHIDTALPVVTNVMLTAALMAILGYFWQRQGD